MLNLFIETLKITYFKQVQRLPSLYSKIENIKHIILVFLLRNIQSMKNKLFDIFIFQDKNIYFHLKRII